MIGIPAELVASQARFNGEAGRAFVAALPGRAREFLDRWGLAWTLGRVLQNGLWDVRDGEAALDPDHVSIARTLLARAR